ncbi:tumor necrosis factor receptor superfamily member 13C [Ochotona princeps]|uniref:tumor necrosis factor receptor superfamily member 13C n=1 Tax=Ochotona princeps TaxID=9978 RepID=UPI00271476BC|nr:tumor necrosis factor receptor superfamily member 13C [Ochotona princeps]
MRQSPRRPRGRDGPAPTSCIQAQCFDPLVRHCVACSLLRTPEPRHAGGSSLAPGTALQPQESVGVGIAEGALPLPGLLFGAPALLSLVLALALVALVTWKRRRRRPGAPFPKVQNPAPDEPLDDVIIPAPGAPDATAANSLGPREEPGPVPPGHSIPVPATELGSTELVTTKTAGPEQQ